MRDIRSLGLTNILDVTPDHAVGRAKLHQDKIGLPRRDTQDYTAACFLRASGRIHAARGAVEGSSRNRPAYGAKVHPWILKQLVVREGLEPSTSAL